MGFWQLGNTSVRSAMRLRDGLIALSSSGIQGNIRKGAGDLAFRKLLGESGVVSLGDDVTNSVGRKWRSAMGKLGFIFPQIEKSWGIKQQDLGKMDTITPAGWNLVQATTVPAIQECFLRAMVVPLFQTSIGSFSPLCWTLALLLELDNRGLESSISFVEMARIVQISSPADGLAHTVDNILRLREERNSSNKKKRFDTELYKVGAAEVECRPRTFIDYADMNIRYLKATGMVQAKGKGICLVPEKSKLAKLLLREPLLSLEPKLDLVKSLCNGTKLPTDDIDSANAVLADLLTRIQRYGVCYSFAGKPLDTSAQINQVRFEVEELISEKKEEQYATRQATQWEEIVDYMDLLISKRDYKKVSDDLDIRIPYSEAPAYLEWCLWRAFLAIDSLTNKPYEIRRFKIDQDFLPISTAPGNGPDLVAEFDDCVIVVEVTLSESSRQEAMEGEPVRRHVADLVNQYEKPVYGLFIANKLDSNTAETFRIGVWYTRDDVRLDLHIVPFTLLQFRAFFKTIFLLQDVTPQHLIGLLLKCEKNKLEYEAPKWKIKIEGIVDDTICGLKSHVE